MADKTLLQVISSGLANLGIKGNWGDPGIYRSTDHGFWSWLLANGGSAANFTGKSVSATSVMQLSTAWACVNLISCVLGSLPFSVSRRQPDGSKIEAPGERLHQVLGDTPNADMAADVFWQCYIASMLLWGFGAAQKGMTSRGEVYGLNFLMPSQLKRQKINGVPAWRYTDPDSGATRTIPDVEMWYTPAFTLDGRNGLSPVSMGANVFGQAISADMAAADTFSKGLRSPGLVLMDATLQSQQREDIRKHIKTVSDQGGVMVLEKGAGFQQLVMNPQDAELLGSRSFNVEEICRWFRVDPSLVGHGAKDSNWGTGLEQKMLWLTILTLRFWCVRVERSVRRGVMTADERRRISGEFNLEALLRGDSASRAAFYSVMVQNGIYTRDFVRQKENLPAMGGNAGVLTVQSNLLPIDRLGDQPDGQAAADALKAWLGINSNDPSKDD
jgi:HK97 family phage portal protein